METGHSELEDHSDIEADHSEMGAGHYGQVANHSHREVGLYSESAALGFVRYWSLGCFEKFAAYQIEKVTAPYFER